MWRGWEARTLVSITQGAGRAGQALFRFLRIQVHQQEGIMSEQQAVGRRRHRECTCGEMCADFWKMHSTVMGMITDAGVFESLDELIAHKDYMMSFRDMLNCNACTPPVLAAKTVVIRTVTKVVDMVRGMIREVRERVCRCSNGRTLRMWAECTMPRAIEMITWYYNGFDVPQEEFQEVQADLDITREASQCRRWREHGYTLRQMKQMFREASEFHFRLTLARVGLVPGRPNITRRTAAKSCPVTERYFS